MPKVWKNVNCTFQTLNTVNQFGNSQYSITGNPNRMQRYAPINNGPGRNPNQVHFNQPKAVCYLQPGSFSETWIMNMSHDHDITIFSVLGETIALKTPVSS